MVRDIVQSLKKLHNFGYSHGDLKPGNIHAKQLRDNKFKFTLMGLSNAARLVKLGTNNQGLGNGNIVFSSLDALQNIKPTQLDDLYSLLCVAYYFIEGSLPWIDYVESY